MSFLKDSLKLRSNSGQVDSSWFWFSPFNFVLYPLVGVLVLFLGNIYLFCTAVLILLVILFYQIRIAYKKSNNKKAVVFQSILLIVVSIFTFIIFYRFSEIIRSTGIY